MNSNQPPPPHGVQPPPPRPGGFQPYAPPAAPHAYAPPPAAYPLAPYGYQVRDQVLAQVELASPGARLLARIIDNVVYFLPFAIPAIGDGMDVGKDTTGVLAAIAFVAVLVIVVLQAVLIAYTSQSFGKKLLGLKMIRHDGSDAGFVHGWLTRSFLWGLLEGLGNMMFVGIPALVDSLLIFSENHQTVHDRMSSTYVIVVR